MALGHSMSRGAPHAALSVAVIIPTYDRAALLPVAIESCLRQTYPISEIVVVDDGSSDQPEEVVRRYPGVRCIRKANGGVSSARNVGLRATRTDCVIFLDADDELLPGAVEDGLHHLAQHPGAAYVAGGFEVRYADGVARDLGPGRITDHPSRCTAGRDSYLDFLRRGNHVTMHAAVLYNRSPLEALGGFDESLPACEDYQVLMELARRHPVAHHDRVVAVYHRHGNNMSGDPLLMLRTSLAVLGAQWPHCAGDPRRRSAYRAGIRHWKARYGGMVIRRAILGLTTGDLGRLGDLLRLIDLAPGAVVYSLTAKVRRELHRLGTLPSSATPATESR